MAASTRAVTPTLSGHFGGANRPGTPGAMDSHARHNGSTFGGVLTKSPRGLSPRRSPQPLTGAAALEDQRRERSRQTSPNPQAQMLQSLLGASPNMSRPHDGVPDPAQMSAPVEKAAKSLIIPDQNVQTGMQTSPVSLSSFASSDMTTATTATAMEPTAGPMQGQEGPGAQHHQHQQHQPQHQHIAPTPGENAGNRAFTFPGPQPLQAEFDPRQPTRQMSLPGGYQNSPKPSPGKRHKCPHCSTEFTRHHNLKSHLLTHSQEKPYECHTCQSRFRRLHDLKRHAKLHTGERNHQCDKCGRRFARGDALARHGKGQGGCAGRRSSFEMGDDVDGKGEDMGDIMYQHDRDDDADDDEDGSGRRDSEPARKRQNTGNSTQAPSLQFGGNNHQPNPFVPSGMTESPKPISPGHAEQSRLVPHDGSVPDPRSPNMAPHMNHQSFSRRPGSESSHMGLAPPQHQTAHHLPPIAGLNHPMVGKQGSQGGSKNGPSMLHQQMAAPGAEPQPGALSSLEARMRRMEEERRRADEVHQQQIRSLQEEVQALRGQLAQEQARKAASVVSQQEAQDQQQQQQQQGQKRTQGQ